jgi:hypothetical protein
MQRLISSAARMPFTPPAQTWRWAEPKHTNFLLKRHIVEILPMACLDQSKSVSVHCIFNARSIVGKNRMDCMPMKLRPCAFDGGGGGALIISMYARHVSSAKKCGRRSSIENTRRLMSWSSFNKVEVI